MAEPTKAISDHPDWFDLSAQEQQTVVDADFQKNVASHSDFTAMDTATKDKVRIGHQAYLEEAALKSTYNPVNIAGVEDQATTDSGSFMGNTFRQGSRSLGNTLDRVPMVDDLVGGFSDSYPKQLSNYLLKQANAPMNYERKQLAKDMKTWGETTDESGFVGDVAASLKLVGDMATNPGAIIDVAAESLGSMASMGIGAWGGAKVGGLAGGTIGSVVPGAGTVAGAATGAGIGAAGGMFAGEFADAGTAKMGEKFQEELDKRGLAPTESNIRSLIDKNPELVKDIQSTARTYGGVLGVVDVLMGGFFSKLTKALPTRAARKEFIGTMDDTSRAVIKARAKDVGASVTDVTEDFINRGTKETLAGKSFKSKLKGATTRYTAEVAGEPISEAAATGSIGEEIKAEDLIYETLGGIGAGPISTSITTAALGGKVAGDKTKAFTDKIKSSTPESRAAAKENKAEVTAAKKQSKAPTVHGYKAEVAATDPGDASVDEIAKTDPIKAVSILATAQATDTTAVDKARKINKDFLATMIDEMTEASALSVKLDSGQELTDTEAARYTHLGKVLAAKESTQKQLADRVDKMKNKEVASAKEATDKTEPIDLEKASTPEEVTKSITDSFGSHPLEKAQITAQLAKEPAGSANHDLLTNMDKEIDAKEQVTKALRELKGIDAVSQDIYDGARNSEFRGINSYKRAIATALTTNKKAEAEAQLDSLKRFRDTHQLKSNRMQQIFAIAEAHPGKDVEQFLSPALQQDYADLRMENARTSKRGKPFEIHNNSGKLVASVASEANALNAAVATQESLFKAQEAKTEPTTKVDTQKASEAPTTKPVTEIKQPTTGVTDVKARKPVVQPTQEDNTSVQDIATARLPTIASPTAKKHIPKELVKTRQATQYIGDGGPRSSTSRYREMYDELGVANTGEYTADDVVYVSSNGHRKGRVNPVVNGVLQGQYRNVDKAIKAGATIIMDTKAHLVKTQKYNIGETALARYMAANGYQRQGESGIWKPASKPISESAKVPTNEQTKQPDVVVETKEERVPVSEVTPELSVGPAVELASDVEMDRRSNDPTDPTVKKGGIYYVRDDGRKGLNNIAGSTKAGLVYVNLDLARDLFTNKLVDGKKVNDTDEKIGGLSPQKRLMLQSLDVSPDEFLSVFDNQVEFNAFLARHEKDHITNSDAKSYPRNADGKLDMLHKDSVAIERRATENALTDKQKSRIQSIKDGRVANREVTDNLEEAITQDLGVIPIEYTDTDGTTVIKSYNEAIAETDARIEEAKRVLDCCRKP
jgi:hypothetical protein